MTADNLSDPSRDFYESARLKTFYSIMLSTVFLFCLAMCSCTGGDAQFASLSLNNVKPNGVDWNSDQKDYWLAYEQSNGFAATMWAFSMLMVGAFMIYYSPLIMGSPNEKSTLKDPIEISNDDRGSFVTTGNEPHFA